jgi:broad specificity phosphatase PhoE
MFKRAKRFLHKIISKHHQDTVLFVGHRGINKAMIAVITGKKPEDINAVGNQDNASVNIFEIDEDKNHKIHVFNCTKHLD